MALIQSTAIPSGATAYEIDQSLRFDRAGVTYLSKDTVATSAGRKKFTISLWFKLGTVASGTGAFFRSEDAQFTYEANGKISCTGGSATSRTAAVFRDPNSWYHVVFAVDTTQGTASNRVKIYINGVHSPSENTGFPGQNVNVLGASGMQYISSNFTPGGAIFDGYMAEYHFLDTIAATPADFGETGTYGEWKPIEYSGSYGTNGFYLPFKQDYTVEGFSTVTYSGNGSNRYLGGFGFQPDFIWQKTRDYGYGHQIVDAVRGTSKEFYAITGDSGGVEDNSTTGLTGFKPDGVTIGTGNGWNSNNRTQVIWAWDMGGSNATNNDGSYTSTVRANTAYGQSIVSYDATKVTNATVGHGLNSAPEMIIAKSREEAYSWVVYHKDLNGGTNPHTKRIYLNTTAAEVTESSWGNAQPTSDVFTLGGDEMINPTNSKGVIAYCFHSVTGYSKFGSYTGNGSANHAITGLGFKPAFLLIKKSSGAHDWVLTDNTRNPSEPLSLLANTSDVETNQDGDDVTSFDADGFKVGTNGRTNGNTETFIYAAFADKREYAYWLDQSGNNNDWTSNQLTESDISVDSPTNNFATWNPLSSIVLPTLSEGNLKNGGENNKAMAGTFGVSTGKWYWEINVLNNSQVAAYIGVTKFSMENDPDVSPTLSATSGRSVYRFRATPLYKNFTATAYVDDSAHGLADYGILGLALDLDNGTIKYYVNNTLYHTDSTIPSDGTTIYPFLTGTYAGGSGWNTAVANFGQDSSFAGNKTAQGNQDGNSIGDFYYTPPTGFLALCTSNLPAVAVVPSENFNTVLWTGNDTARTISGVGFQPDFTWIRNREIVTNHLLFDAIRGAKNSLRSDLTNVESTNASDELLTFASDGFTLGTGEDVNGNAEGIVSWNWKAGGSGTAVSESGSGNNCVNASTHSANADAGFSIVKYVGRKDELSNGQHSKVTHGMGSNSPELIIIKNRDATDDWMVIGDALNTSSDWDHRHLNLNNTDAKSGSDYSGATVPNSTHFFISNADSVNTTDENYIAYCFASVDGYSKVGSYTGNGNDDGTFVYTGFRPAYLMIKKSSGSEAWWIVDTARKEYNPHEFGLQANDSAAELTVSKPLDILSNGFKSRKATGYHNDNGATYIYLAFAETPFKYSNAR